ncbi:Nop52-domain-containing protein [Auriculariales sp. MPI-PUGE-AT-0066]|nr:Nop52-domain-containing protein [Auriculariales sp. MPI-PUGE-AT-0066]
MATTTVTVPPLAKNLAATEKKLRDRGVKDLREFLADEEAVKETTKLDLDKVMKSIFYCYWMSDKPLIQQALATELADLVLTISVTDDALRFLRSFWETTVREWSGLDRLRMDKFYMLVRRFVNSSFRLLAKSKWDEVACTEFNAMLTARGCPLCPDDPKIPQSLAYHLSDIFMEELDKVMSQDSKLAPAPLATLLQPYLSLAASTGNARTFERISTAILRPLFAALQSAVKKPAPSSDEDGCERPAKRMRLDDAALSVLHPSYTATLTNARLNAPTGGMAAMKVPDLRSRLITWLFEQASKEDVREANRRKLYALWKEEMDEQDFALPSRDTKK